MNSKTDKVKSLPFFKRQAFDKGVEAKRKCLLLFYSVGINYSNLIIHAFQE